MSKLKLIALFSIVIDVGLLLVYFIYKTEKDAVTMLSIENAKMLFTTLLMLYLSYWMIVLAENKEFMQIDEETKNNGFRGVKYSTRGQY